MIPVTLSPSSWAEAWVADVASGFFERLVMMLISMMCGDGRPEHGRWWSVDDDVA
ncbi:hypothetical protein [Sphingobium sp. MP9-4]|jgi:hypothetical protein|uniref:hypothetical protein n=1 Tax=Sphingobium sp. MP9-4 TaxID=1761936 RepID=UPI00148543E3|nr:hypothetical protein [Sphingobium sp. MP9-4]